MNYFLESEYKGDKKYYIHYKSDSCEDNITIRSNDIASIVEDYEDLQRTKGVTIIHSNVKNS